ncbi:6-phosphofructokinase [Francisella philomiragia]|uniref:ATP-dependent 6-phosphofructokinase n=1 Tax=Francisella philomiragia TaxID=28110 RepID=A0ABS1GBL4_9GAMM|nr:ATP-dependent 6-phosphofructokinase [Francisella philomiragia]MBK2258139.1 6-phosphofructokinase [Francisella philomiragia]MBK2302063.1 6-phosphofructokinase [Francisella philomiragia]
MKKRIGILTSGGDCPGLNAAIRGLAKSSYDLFNCEFVGIRHGYKGLIDGDYYEMKKSDFSGILTLGGTMLGSKRTPFKEMRNIGEDGIDKVASMVKNYKKMNLDCLVTLGGNGTHKNANLLREEGLNVIGLPKTIDNDIYGTDFTFGFHSAIDIATDVIDKIHTTASSHDRVMIVELMGNKAGWLTLYAGLAGGADIVLIPEIPYSIDSVYNALLERQKQGKNFSIIAIAEGAKTIEEAQMKKRELEQYRSEMQYHTVSYRLAEQINKKLGFDTRVTVPGHTQRGGAPSALDRILATKFGAFAAKMIKDENYGKTVSIVENKLKATPLEEMAYMRKPVTRDCDEFKTALQLGVSFGE